MTSLRWPASCEGSWGLRDPRGCRGGAAGKDVGADPVSAPPLPASPSCDVSAWPLVSPFRSVAPHPQGPGVRPLSLSWKLTRCPGGACNAAAAAGTWGGGGAVVVEGGKKRGREEALVPLLLPPAGRP